MGGSDRLRRFYLVAFLTVVAVITGWAVVAGNATIPELSTAVESIFRTPIDSGQLAFYDRLPEGALDDQPCEGPPADVSSALAADPMQEEKPGALAGRSSREGVPADGKKPVRMIHDRYASLSSLAVDPINNELVVTDENLFNVLIYDRVDNTPPTGITQPKRAIGGLKTKIEFQSGVYVDPKNGEIYAVNNDTVDTLVIFSRATKGDVRPEREVHTPHGTFGIAVDEEHQEMLLTVQHDSAVVTFQKTAKSEDAPIRLLQGDHTLLADPHGMALDAKNDLIFVTNHGSVHQHRPGEVAARGRIREADLRKANWPLGFSNAIPGSGKNLPPSITVYARMATGDTAPLRVIQGAKTQMNWPTGIAFDARNNELFVANDMGDSILVFSTSANGDVAPLRVLRGPKTLIKNPTGVYVDSHNDELWVANFGNHTATAYKLSAEGNTAPLRVIRSAPQDQPTLSIGNPHPVAYDTKREELLVPN
jgi:DNA-binding beta-propeller fold protein YncE